MLALIVVLLIVALLCWAIQSFLPIDGMFKNILCFAIVIVYCLWALQSLGIISGI